MIMAIPNLQSYVTFPNISRVQVISMAPSLPPIGSLGLKSPPTTSSPHVSKPNLSTGYHDIDRHLHTPGDLLGHPILLPSNIMATSTTSGPSTSGLFFIS